MNELKKRSGIAFLVVTVFFALFLLLAHLSTSSQLPSSSFSQGISFGEQVGQVDDLYAQGEISSASYGKFVELEDEFYYNRTTAQLQKWQKCVDALLSESEPLYSPRNIDMFVIAYQIQANHCFLKNYTISSQDAEQLHDSYHYLLENLSVENAQEYLDELVNIMHTYV